MSSEKANLLKEGAYPSQQQQQPGLYPTMQHEPPPPYSAAPNHPAYPPPYGPAYQFMMTPHGPMPVANAFQPMPYGQMPPGGHPHQMYPFQPHPAMMMPGYGYPGMMQQPQIPPNVAVVMPDGFDPSARFDGIARPQVPPPPPGVAPNPAQMAMMYGQGNQVIVGQKKPDFF